MLAQDGAHIFVGIPAVNYYGKFGLGSDNQLSDENLALHGTIGVIVKIIEADFTNSHYFGVRCSSPNSLLNLHIVGLCLVRMNTLGTENLVLTLGQISHDFEVIGAYGNGNDAFDANLASMPKFLGQRICFKIIKMAVCLNNRVGKARDIPALFFTHGL